MDVHQKVLFVDAATGYYRMGRYRLGDFFGPVDLGLHLAGKHNSLNIGTGLLAGSVFPGSNRLIFTGFSPCWGGFYVSSMGGAGLVFDNLGINMLSLVGRAAMPSVLVLNRSHGEEIEVLIEPVDVQQVWRCGRGGVYGMMDYEPYQTMGPLCGIFDQRAAERINHHADAYGFDAISVGGVLSWLMECLDRQLVQPAELGVTRRPVFTPTEFGIETDSMHNAELGMALLDAIIEKRGVLDLGEGARKFARRLARDKGKEVLDPFVHVGFGRKGWMVPNQYWTPGALSPMPIMGKYYMYYGNDFAPPRTLGRINAERFRAELILDNLGLCRFHRQWGEEMLPEIMGSLYGRKEQYLERIAMTAKRINSRNSSVSWESQRNADFVLTFLRRQHDVENNRRPEVVQWLNEFRKDKHEAAYNFWYEIHKGAHESLREF